MMTMSKKTARNRSYWQKRFLQEKDNQLTNASEYESAMRARLKEVERVLEEEVDYWLKRYANNQEISHEDACKILSTIGTRDWHMTLKEFIRKAKEGGFDKELDAEYFKSQLSRLENIDEQLTNLLSQYATSESDKLEQSLSNQFQQTYMHSIYLTQLEQVKLSSNFANVNEYQVKAIVNKPWNGSNFSKRIWKDYTEVLPDDRVRWSRDPETGKGTYVENMTFDQWKKAVEYQRQNESLSNTAARYIPKSGKYNWNELNAEQYNKHVKGTPEFDNYAKGRKRPVSELIISPAETQALIDKYGKKRQNTDKQKVLFNHNSYIGLWADINGNYYPTKQGRIGYSKRGCHVTPQKPDYLK